MTQKTYRFTVLMAALFVGVLLAAGLLAMLNPTGLVYAQTAVGTIITVNTTNDELNGDGDCSLREAVQAANSDTAVSGCPAGSGWDTINVPAGTYILTRIGTDEDANATGDLDLLESVSIVGAGSDSTILDGNGTDRVLHVDPTDLGVTLDLQGVKVTNGSSDFGGGLRQNNGQTIIQDTVFTGNNVSASVTVPAMPMDPAASGGAIHADFGVLEILSSKISYNNSVGSGKGGGIALGAAALHMIDSQLLHNKGYDGGGIYADYGSLTIQASQFANNKAARDGGGIAVDDSTILIEGGSEFSNNEAVEDGGGLYADSDSRITIYDSSFHDNTAEFGAGISTEGYGAHLVNVTIEKNKATEYGGGIYSNGDLIIYDSAVRYNHSEGTSDGGGGIYEDGNYAALVISNTVVFSNTTDGYGGGIYMYEYGGLYVFNSVFEQNNAAKDGGGVYLEDEASMNVEDSVFRDNHADNGGAIYIYEEGGLILERSTLNGNSAITDGGALYLAGSDYAPADIRNSTISDNHAGNDGGGIYAYYPGVALNYATVVDNTAGNSGGGIFEDGYSTWSQNSIVAGNRVAGNPSHPNADCDMDSPEDFYSGGFNILGEGTGCQATRYDQSLTPGTLFANVLAPLADNGGPLLPDGTRPETHALLAGSAAIDAADDIFCPDVDERGVSRAQRNACDIGAYESDSGAVVAQVHNVIEVNTTDDELNTDGDCSLREALDAANRDTAVDKCAAGDGWDRVSLPAGNYVLSIAGDTEDLNQTGDLDVITQSVTLVGAGSWSTIIDGDDLDRVLHVGPEASLRLENVTLNNGHSPSYGGCMMSDTGLLLVINSVMSQCVSDSNGGGIFVGDGGAARLSSSTVRGNRSKSENGGIYNSYGILSIDDSSIINNEADSYGGGVMSYYGTTRISNSSIMSNTILNSYDGGGIYHEVGSLIVEEGTEISHNQVGADGGGIYGEEGLVLVRDSTISHNHSDEDGGGYSGSYGGLVMFNTVVEGNSSGDDGGGLYYASGLIRDSIVRNNKAATNGGGIEGWSVIQDTLVNGNKAAYGGGIYNEGSTLYNVTVSNNTAWKDGGGMYANGYGTQIFDSSFSDNSGRDGAGVYADDYPVLARGSTFSGNDATGSGGGLYSLKGALDLLNSTVSGNSAVEGGGAAIISGTLSLNLSTVAENSSIGDGGGLFNGNASVVHSSVLAGNSANGSSTDSAADCEADSPLTFAGYSLFGAGTGCDAAGVGDLTAAPADVFTTVLGPLADNGGSTETHALLPGSPAIDLVPLTRCWVTIDQRGVSRPLGAACDSGAFEYIVRILLPIITN